MQIIKEELDSLAFGKSVLKIEDIDISCGFKKFEESFIAEFDPVYVYARIPIENLPAIHYLENNGFGFIETQFKMTKRLVRLEDTEIFGDQYALYPCQREDLETIYELSDNIMNIDRVFLDDKIDGKSISKKRYRLYIEKSFNSSDENVLKTIDRFSNKSIGFFTNRLLNNTDILCYIGGIVDEFKNTGAAFAAEILYFNYFFKKGFKNLTTHISASNYKVINLEMRNLGYKPKQTYIILRKVY